jgi:hypothetical protein
MRITANDVRSGGPIGGKHQEYWGIKMPYARDDLNVQYVTPVQNRDKDNNASNIAKRVR